ncbi:G patch domain and ankyrin repeat-containing protein 1 isoform X2 [Brachyhypopomus gauderio]|uniref:G patch domain and ankyrin repeat-containing protein 1 isoform X2 n=1 Tax=Brachyhypopomus gauderio TaxID=698409 RepID=UPI00404197B2
MFEGAVPVMSGVGLFIRATQEDRRWTEGQRPKEDRVQSDPLTGEEASDFYRSLLPKEGGPGRRETRRTRPRRGGTGHGGRPRLGEAGEAAVPPGDQLSVAQEREGHRLLCCAQNGDVCVLRELLRRGCDVNFHDTFYWTPMMCASHAGHTDAVRLLLQAGAAWVGVVDTRGRDARDLALLAGHQDVVRELEQFSITENPSTPVEDTPRAQWCAVCEVTYTDSTHNSSTLHQFNVQRPLVAPHYCLPPSSTSYRMMLRSGWDPASGLGPAHTGRKHPVGTVLKRDQAGLGYGSPPRARVTHFHAKDPQAVQRAPKEHLNRKERGVTLNTRALRRREERERDWERRFRASFHLDT